MKLPAAIEILMRRQAHLRVRFTAKPYLTHDTNEYYAIDAVLLAIKKLEMENDVLKGKMKCLTEKELRS